MTPELAADGYAPLSGHRSDVLQCSLLGVKRTWRFQVVMSAFDPKWTSITAICGNAQQCTVDVVALLSRRALRYIFMWSIFMCFIGEGGASAAVIVNAALSPLTVTATL
jgi:hypothetical protein